MTEKTSTLASDEITRDEAWRAVPGYYPYEASDIGRIRNTKTGRVLKSSPPVYDGYCRVGLSTMDNSTVKDVHRIIALAFLGEPPIDQQGIHYFVNHKNGIKTDNRLTNLEYATSGENTAHYHNFVRPNALQKKADTLKVKTWRQVENLIIKGEIELVWKTKE